jgi:CheY-like chemotaxis protein
LSILNLVPLCSQLKGGKNNPPFPRISPIPALFFSRKTMKSVAVVENNRDNRLLLRAILGDLYHILEYETGFEALAAFQESLPDIVLLDIALPGMDGVEVLQRIRETPGMQQLPVIALTAHAMSGDRERFLSAGFDDYVSKPIIDEKVLLNTIEVWLRKGKQKG